MSASPIVNCHGAPVARELATWRFAEMEIPRGEAFTVSLPAGARILSVTVRAGKPLALLLMNPNAGPITRYFYLWRADAGVPGWFALGLKDGKTGAYVGTLIGQEAGREMALHLFESFAPIRVGTGDA